MKPTEGIKEADYTKLIILCCHIALLTKPIERFDWPGNCSGDETLDELIKKTGHGLKDAREAILGRLVNAVIDLLPDENPEPAAPASPDLIATKVAEQLVGQVSDIENLGEMIAAKADSLVDGLLVQQRAKIARLEAALAEADAALAPFARIHERRSEGNERSASVSQSPAACSVQDCQAAWLALNPAAANAVRDIDPDPGDREPGP